MPDSLNLSQLSTPNPQDPLSPKMVKLLNEKKSAREFQIRKHFDWNENYELYRNKVKTNRLTQRQSVNIPLMRETIKTLLSGSDDAPDVEWQEKSGDDMKSAIYQEMWNEFFDDESLELKDILDKKNVFLYGLSTKKLNLDDDGVCMDVLDVYDVVFDPLMKALDVETSRFIVHQNIFKSLREILVDPRYSKEGKDALRVWAATDKGMVQSGKNKLEWERSVERLRSMGVQNDKFPLFAGGDVIVHLTEHYTNLWNTATDAFERHVVVYADDQIELCDDLLVDCIGMEEWPFEMWAEDPETNDIYPDGVADLVRTPNKILNVWFSQQVENRTLQNFQMHWFDATVQGYQPQTYEPGPGRMLPAPGNPAQTIMPVAINGLDETFKAMDYLTNIVERGSGATALEKGQPEQGLQTLGEVQLLVGKAKERAKTMAKFYKNSWFRLAQKWDMMMQNNTFPSRTLYKTGDNGKMYDKKVYAADWKSKAGYKCIVASSSEQEADDVKNLQKFAFVQAQSPQNSALRSIMLKRGLKILDLSPAELNEVEMVEQKLASLPPPGTTPQGGTPAAAPAAQPTPTNAGDQQLSASIQDSLAQLGQMM